MKALLLPTSCRLLLLVLLHVAAFTTQAQTGGSMGIGTSAPAASAALGILTPATDLSVFQAAPKTGFRYYGGSAAGWLLLPHCARNGTDKLGSGADLGRALRADGGLNLGQNTRSRNVYSGYQAEEATTMGAQSYFNGYCSGGVGNTMGSSNGTLGYEAGPTTGDLTHAGELGCQAKVSQSNSLLPGGTSPNAVHVGEGSRKGRAGRVSLRVHLAATR